MVRTVRKVEGRYEKSMVRIVHGTKSPQMVRNVYGTKSLWYEKPGSRRHTCIMYYIGLHPTFNASPCLTIRSCMSSARISRLPAHEALRPSLVVNTRASHRPDDRPEWKRPRGRPRQTWIRQCRACCRSAILVITA